MDEAARGEVERLLRLSEEVTRVAATLAQRSVESPDSESAERRSKRKVPELDPDQVNRLIQMRRRRSQYLPEDLFADPAWDMLLELLHAEATDRRIPVSGLCAASGVPSTTALRWIGAMVERGLINRCEDRHDRRRAYLALAPEISRALRLYFAEAVVIRRESQSSN